MDVDRHWTECGRATSVAITGALGRPRRSVCRSVIQKHIIKDGLSIFVFNRTVRWGNSKVSPAPGADKVEQSLQSSVIISPRHVADGFVGCARAVTDKVTCCWICDVVVHEGHRRRGVGKELVRRLLAHPDVAATRKVLVSKDSQSLYRQLGFDTHRYECSRWEDASLDCHCAPQ